MMTEREYIDATNLAKLRTAITIIQDCLPMEAKEDTDRIDALNRLEDWRDRLTKKVKLDVSDPTSGTGISP